MSRAGHFLLILVLALPEVTAGAPEQTLQVELPRAVLRGVPFDVRVRGVAVADSPRGASLDGLRVADVAGGAQIALRPEEALFPSPGEVLLRALTVRHLGKRSLRITWNGQTVEAQVLVLPGVLSILPPLVAIALALATRQVLVALLVGTWLGVTFLQAYNPFAGLLRTLDHYVIEALADPDHVAIVLFSMTLGGMVGVVSRSGGMQGIVQSISRWGGGRRGAQLAVWALGVLVFFDDYANTLIVGNTMRPFTDRMRISREKLSYIVDSTAAPVASVALVSTWVGFQVGLIDSALKALGLGQDPYILFLRSIPLSAYSLLAIALVAMVALSLRDLGPMWKAEYRAATTGKVLRDGAQPISDAASFEATPVSAEDARWWNALVPILLMIATTFLGLYLSGRSELGAAARTARVGQIVGAANSFHVLMWASFLAAVSAIGLAVGQRILTLAQALESWLAGVRAMVLAMVILVLAWAIGKVCADLHAADYVIQLAKGVLSPPLLPAVVFVVAAFTSFATGTSWATMAILVPIAVPMAHKLCLLASVPPAASERILVASVGAVLSGSVFGDHCSPISDTTIMSSMASAADHIDHVRTQLLYALLAAAVSLVTCYLPCGFGFPAGLGLLSGIGLLTLLLLAFGKRVPNCPLPSE
ncbi:MAG: Na+/H+ antiporter NhaC family protein [candidate division KSB1 bacterium]|nr:Na+/H+ antiporter NhaC family protein [candidate division KSB1 bacterium]